MFDTTLVCVWSLLIFYFCDGHDFLFYMVRRSPLSWFVVAMVASCLDDDVVWVDLEMVWNMQGWRFDDDVWCLMWMYLGLVLVICWSVWFDSSWKEAFDVFGIFDDDVSACLWNRKNVSIILWHLIIGLSMSKGQNLHRMYSGVPVVWCLNVVNGIRWQMSLDRIPITGKNGILRNKVEYYKIQRLHRELKRMTLHATSRDEYKWISVKKWQKCSCLISTDWGAVSFGSFPEYKLVKNKFKPWRKKHNRALHTAGNFLKNFFIPVFNAAANAAWLPHVGHRLVLHARFYFLRLDLKREEKMNI